MFQQDAIVLARSSFAAVILGRWQGANTVFYFVRDCKTGREGFLCEDEVAPFYVIARQLNGQPVLVQLTRQHENSVDFYCLYLHEEVVLPRTAIEQVYIPAQAAA